MTSDGLPRRPLEGVRIVDFTHVLVGGYCSLMWSSLGAECIKVESSARRDPVRTRSGRAAARDRTQGQMSVRRARGGLDEFGLNKRSITLNLREPRAIELAKRVVAVSDMVGENFRPGVLERRGLGWDVLREVNPGLVYISMSAGGGYGPDREDAGYASVFAAMSGFSSMWGYEDGPPVLFRLPSDMCAGAMGAFVSIAALVRARRTGKGQHIDLANRETLASYLGDAFLDYSYNGRVPARRGNRHPAWAPHGVYPSAGEHEGGRWISIAVTSDDEWRALVAAMGAPEWAGDPRFAHVEGRLANQDELDARIGEWTADQDGFELMERLQAAGVAATPVGYPEDVAASPQLEARGAWREVALPQDGGTTRWFSPPWRFSKTPTDRLDPAPEMGEANHYVFCELLGMDEDEVEQLSAEGVIA
ncbi:MAG: CoA transferase [Chloroflexi bacterium]|nr:CoA transferase [Chloroflexota bacterium]